jgi:hypothetical protein
MFTVTTQFSMAPGALQDAAPAPVQSVREADILREQLEYLIEHTACSIPCECSVCSRYGLVRSLLLEIFGEPHAAAVPAVAGQLAKAA